MVTIAICLGNSLFMFRGKFKLLDIFSSIILIELDFSKIHCLHGTVKLVLFQHFFCDLKYSAVVFLLSKIPGKWS